MNWDAFFPEIKDRVRFFTTMEADQALARTCRAEWKARSDETCLYDILPRPFPTRTTSEDRPRSIAVTEILVKGQEPRAGLPVVALSRSAFSRAVLFAGYLVKVHCNRKTRKLEMAVTHVFELDNIQLLSPGDKITVDLDDVMIAPDLLAREIKELQRAAMGPRSKKARRGDA